MFLCPQRPHPSVVVTPSVRRVAALLLVAFAAGTAFMLRTSARHEPLRLVASVPADGSDVTGPVDSVTLTFSQVPDRASSHAAARSSEAPRSGAAVIRGRTVVVPVAGGAGDHQIGYHVAAQGQVASGSVRFTVAAGSGPAATPGGPGGAHHHGGDSAMVAALALVAVVASGALLRLMHRRR